VLVMVRDALPKAELTQNADTELLR
jgi:hypothetical protein